MQFNIDMPDTQIQRLESLSQSNVSVSDQTSNSQNCVGLVQQVRDMQKGEKDAEKDNITPKHISYGPKQLGSFKNETDEEYN